MLRTLALTVGLVFSVVACDTGGVQTEGLDVDAVKAVLADLIEASLNDDLESVRPNLDVGQYLQAMDSPLAFKKDMTPEELEAEARSCFNQLLAVKNQSKLQNRQAIDEAMRGAQVSLLVQTRSATVVFQAPDSTRDGVVKYRCRFTQTPGGTWKLITLEIEF